MAKADRLSRRERQIMDIVYERGQATAAEAMEALPDPPSYSAVRSALRLLVEKGYLKHRHDGPRYVYFPTVSSGRAGRTALRHVMKTFFEGSMENAVASLLEIGGRDLTPEELDRLIELMEQAKEEGR